MHLRGTARGACRRRPMLTSLVERSFTTPCDSGEHGQPRRARPDCGDADARRSGGHDRFPVRRSIRSDRRPCRTARRCGGRRTAGQSRSGRRRARNRCSCARASACIADPLRHRRLRVAMRDQGHPRCPRCAGVPHSAEPAVQRVQSRKDVLQPRRCRGSRIPPARTGLGCTRHSALTACKWPVSRLPVLTARKAAALRVLKTHHFRHIII